MPWLLGSALYSSFQRLIQHLVVINISIRLAMTVWIWTVFILPKTYSTSVCQHYFHKTCHGCWGLLKCLPPTLPQDLPWLLRSALCLSFQTLIQQLFVSNISIRLVMTVAVCTVFNLSKTYSTSVCKKHFHKTCHDCWGLHCIHPFIDLFNI